MKSILEEIFQKFEQSIEKYSEYDVADEISSRREELDSSSPATKAEWIAFNLIENYRWKNNSGWETYFGPMMVAEDAAGNIVETPDINSIDKAHVEHWKQRMNESIHPILKCRYSNLVWDLHKKITGRPPGKESAEILIDSAIELAKNLLYIADTSIFEKLEHALSVSISIKDSARSQKCKESILDYESAITDDHSPGLWGYSLDIFLARKVYPASEAEELRIVSEMEQRLERLFSSSSPDLDPWSIKAASLPLASYFNKKNDIEKVEALLKGVEDAFNISIPNVEPLQASSWLQMLHDMYLEFGLKSEAERIRLSISALGAKVNESLREFSTSISISNEEIDQYLDNMTRGGLDSSIHRLIAQFIPRREAVKSSLLKLSKEAPLAFLFNSEILDDKGRVVARLGPLEEDMEGHIIRRINQDISLGSGFLRMVIQALRDRHGFDAKSAMDFIGKAPIIPQDSKPLVEHAIECYFKDNHISFCHVIIPQFEAALRHLLEKCGVGLLKPARAGGYFMKLFDEILREPVLANIFKEDIILYLKVLLTDQRGWNARNDISHGLFSAAHFNQTLSDRLFHAFLILARVRENSEL